MPHPHQVGSPPMDKSLDNHQVPWGWGSLQKGAGLAFGSHQPSPAEVALASPVLGLVP